MERRQILAWCVVFGGLVLASRLPLAPGQLFSFDDVNFAYAIGDFDPRVSRPQPPGYPIFVLESRILYWLRFRRPESNLLALSLAASTAAVVALAWLGNRMLGGDAGLCAAWLLLFHHSFWYSGLTSAVRPHLAVISVVVAALCWRAWCGEKRAMYWGAAALGLGAGIRPELGPLLLPLWAVAAWRARAAWVERVKAVALMAGSVLVWLLPTMFESGGPRSYVQTCAEYLADQSALTSGLFGADDVRWQVTITWLMVWSLSGLLWALPTGLLSWQRTDGWGLGWGPVVFLGLWFTPLFVFAMLVHVADAGQVLGILPVVCLVGGHFVSRAARRLDGWLGREHALVAMLLPGLALSAVILFRTGWYHEGPPATGWRTVAHQIWKHVNSGLSLTSLTHILGIAWVDDKALGELGWLAQERPGQTVVLWERGRTSSRKAAYYFQSLPVVVLSPKTIRETETLAARFMRGPRTERMVEGPAPLRVPLPAGARLVWLVDPKTDFFVELQQTFALREADPLYYNDLPAESGEQRVGKYVFTW